MPAGMNQLARVYRYSFPNDDSVGGSLPSGTLLHDSVLVRIEPLRPTMALLEQGLETVKLYQTNVSYVASDVDENDEFLIYEPVESWYYLKRFKVISVQHPSLRPNDPRSQVVVTLRRWEDAHGRQF